MRFVLGHVEIYITRNVLAVNGVLNYRHGRKHGCVVQSVVIVGNKFNIAVGRAALGFEFFRRRSRADYISVARNIGKAGRFDSPQRVFAVKPVFGRSVAHGFGVDHLDTHKAERRAAVAVAYEEINVYTALDSLCRAYCLCGQLETRNKRSRHVIGQRSAACGAVVSRELRGNFGKRSDMRVSLGKVGCVCKERSARSDKFGRIVVGIYHKTVRALVAVCGEQRLAYLNLSVGVYRRNGKFRVTIDVLNARRGVDNLYHYSHGNNRAAIGRSVAVSVAHRKLDNCGTRRARVGGKD